MIMKQFNANTRTYHYKDVAESLPEEMWFNRDPMLHNHSPEIVKPFQAWHKRLKQVVKE